MAQQYEIKTFGDLSEKYSTWIIKYCSKTFNSPLFLIWYTDTDKNSTDRLLTYKNGDIFASDSLTNLKTTLLSIFENLVVFDNLNPWLENYKSLEIVEYCTYDLISVENAITVNKLDIPTIEDLSEFVNLYFDFIYQDDNNRYLQIYADNRLIKEAWNYFYEYIFWPRLNNKEKFEFWDRPQLVIDTKELLLRLKKIVKTFDDNIRQAEKALK